MKMIRILMIAILITFLFPMISLASSPSLDLTPEEKTFIAEHPEIRLGVDPKFIPYEFIDTDGVYKGIAADYIKLISQRTGLTMTVAPDLTWPEAYEKSGNQRTGRIALYRPNQGTGKTFLVYPALLHLSARHLYQGRQHFNQLPR